MLIYSYRAEAASRRLYAISVFFAYLKIVLIVTHKKLNMGHLCGNGFFCFPTALCGSNILY